MREVFGDPIEPGQADLYLLGAGVFFPDHLTVQTIEILTACSRICTNLPEVKLQALPKEISQKCVCLWPLYQDNRKRIENYRDVIQAVIDNATNHRPCAWMTPGHPFVFDSVSQKLVEKGRDFGWKVQVVPGISSLDTLLAELAYDPCYGLVVHEATSLVTSNLPLLPSFATVLFQPSVFGSDLTHHSHEYGGPSLRQLRDYLLQFYPAQHECAFVYSALSRRDRPRIVWETLENLDSVPYVSLRGSTLYVPPVS
jgi:tetrapyrrole (corrin/porphyrin) methylase-like protein